MAQQLVLPPITELPTRMTYEEFFAWAGDDIRAEWVDGEVIVFVQPNNRHVVLVNYLHELVSLFVRLRGLGQTLGEPFQFLTRRGQAHRRPDLCVFLTTPPDLGTGARAENVPDLVVEVVSDDSETRDRQDKRVEYAEAGVPEYWVVEGREGRRGVTFLALGEDGAYVEIVPDAGGRLGSRVLTGFWLDPEWLMAEPLPSLFRVLAAIAPDAAAAFEVLERLTPASAT